MSTEQELMKLVADYGKECISAGIAELNANDAVNQRIRDDVRKSHEVLTARLRALLTELDAAREAMELEREACASACDALVDTKEAARIERRVNDVLKNGDEEDQLQAMRHQLTVSTFNAGIKECAAAIRARSFA